MKKLIAVVLMLSATVAYAAFNKLSRIGPSSASLSSWASAEQASTIASAGSGIRNCLSNLSLTSSANFTLRVLDGGTTVYAVDVPTTTVTTGGGGAILNREWRDDDMCGSSNTAFIVKITTATNPIATSTQKLNYSGFTY